MLKVRILIPFFHLVGIFVVVVVVVFVVFVVLVVLLEWIILIRGTTVYNLETETQLATIPGEQLVFGDEPLTAHGGQLASVLLAGTHLSKHLLLEP